MNKNFGRQAVMALTGVSRSQVEHWTQLGLVRPSLRPSFGKGTRREYSFSDLVQFKIAKTLRDEGIHLSKIEKCLTVLKNKLPDESKKPEDWNMWLTIKDESCYLTKDVHSIIDLFAKSNKMAKKNNHNIDIENEYITMGVKYCDELPQTGFFYKRSDIHTRTKGLICALFMREIIEQIYKAYTEYSSPKQMKVKVRGKEFNVVLTPDLEDGGFTVQCNEISAAISQGETEVEAMNNIIDALELCLETESVL